MPSRNATTDVLNEIAKPRLKMFHLFKGAFDSGTLFLTDSVRNIVFQGNTYIGLGYFISFDTIEEEADLQTTGVNVTLSGVPSEMVSLVINQDLVDKTLTIHRGFLDDSGNVIPDPLLIFDGQTDGGTFNEAIDSDDGEPDGKAVITLTAVNHWVDFDKINGRRTNHKEQLNLFPDDQIFSGVADLVDKVITWK